MIKGKKNEYTKAEELELGHKVQLGLAAKTELDSIEPSSSNKDKIKELQEIIHDGQTAHDELFMSHIDLANNLARQIHEKTSTRYSLSDIMQDAYIGLSEAIDSYDPSKNCRLSTYAFWKISKIISITINKMRPVRLPENKMGDYLHIVKAEEKFLSTNKNPTDEELLQYVMKVTKLSKETIYLIKTNMLGAISLNLPINEDGTEFSNLIEDKSDNQSMLIENDVLFSLINKLSPKERNIIAFEFRVGSSTMKLKDFMNKYNLDNEAMKKSARMIVRKLRKIANTEKLSRSL